MRIRTEKIKKLVFCGFVLCLTVAIFPVLGLSQASAEILLTDDFENSGRSNTIWTFKNPSAFGVVVDSAKAHSGKGVLEMRYDANTTGPGFEIVVFAKAVPEVYIRWLERYSPDWTWSGIAQKILFVNRNAKSIKEGLMFSTAWGSDEPRVDFENMGDRSDLLQNVGTRKGFGDGQWHCQEWYVKAGPSGSIKLWIDGELKMDHPNVPLPFSVLEGILLSAYYNEGGNTPTGVPHLQYRWIDDFVVSTNRIGCLPETGDKSPPSAPSGLKLIGQ